MPDLIACNLITGYLLLSATFNLAVKLQVSYYDTALKKKSKAKTKPIILCFRFTWKKHLEAHKNLHSDSCLKCPVCGKLEVDQRHMDQHMVVHSTVRNFLCTLCGKAFKRNGDLTQHKNHVHKNVC